MAIAGTGVRRLTLSTQVADDIRARILSGEYEGGLQLRQEHLATELGVSRIPVREALHQLHSEGLVTLVSHKGAVVSEVSLEEIVELYELRARVETWLLGLAIPQMTDDDLAKSQAAAEAFAANKDDPSVSHQLNWEFHKTLYRPSNRNTSIEMIAKILQRIEIYTKMMVAFQTENQSTSDQEHFQIIEACRARDTLRAVSLLDMHIHGGAKKLVARLKELKGGARP